VTTLDLLHRSEISGAEIVKHIGSAARRVLARIRLLWLLRDHSAAFEIDVSTSIEDVRHVIAELTEDDVNTVECEEQR
jgi:hypothetical protein